MVTQGYLDRQTVKKGIFFQQKMSTNEMLAS